ncbi:MAG TPA: BlaI/MecI/CopY family transcriptional regulator [Acidimicrobiales bacterium]|nr:BlaI/MecI/CopY family transcriptional regulator [Acidimicrobiales bacterium]
MAGRKLPHGELEALVMGVLWDGDAPLSPAEVRARLAPARALAYTTVMTILVRLHDKGLVTRERSGRAYLYRPRQSREEQAAQRMGELLATTGDRSLALARFVASLPPDQLAALRRALETEA